VDETVVLNDTSDPEVNEVASTTDDANTTDIDELSGKRGRPRPEVVIERDKKILEAMIGPLTRNQIAEASGIKPSLTYLSLLRLRNENLVKHERSGIGHVWYRATETVINDTNMDDVSVEIPEEIPAETEQ